jgi:hypothetical protein
MRTSRKGCKGGKCLAFTRITCSPSALSGVGWSATKYEGLCFQRSGDGINTPQARFWLIEQVACANVNIPSESLTRIWGRLG